MTEYKISHYRFWKAAENWDKFTGIKHPNAERGWLTFANGIDDFIGCLVSDLKFHSLDCDQVVVPNRECAARFEMLAGPHWETILKIWEIKNDRQRNR